MAMARDGHSDRLAMAMATLSRWPEAREGDDYTLERVMATGVRWLQAPDDGYGREIAIGSR
jgi:hypothetical protein